MESIYFTLVCSRVQMGLPLVQQHLIQFERLVRESMPQVGEHFEKEMINPSMYASQWFILFFHTPSLSHWHFEFGMSSSLRLSLVPHCLMSCFGRRL